jgi:hypothetical protein
MLCFLALHRDRCGEPIESANCPASKVAFPSLPGGYVPVEIVGMQDDQRRLIPLASVNWLGKGYSCAAKCYCSAYDPT